MPPGICQVCQGTGARYRCPKCAVRYCSVACYDKHGGGVCKGLFDARKVEEAMAVGGGVDDDLKKATAEMLLREYQARADEEAEAADAAEDEADAAKRAILEAVEAELSGRDLTPHEVEAIVDALPEDLRREFEGALKDDPAALLNQGRPNEDGGAPGEPTAWWLESCTDSGCPPDVEQAMVAIVGEEALRTEEPTEHRDLKAARPSNRAKITVISSSEASVDEAAESGGKRVRVDDGGAADTTAAAVEDLAPPVPDAAAVAPVAAGMLRRAPSALVPSFVCEVLASYAVVARVYNHDPAWGGDKMGAVELLMDLCACIMGNAAPGAPNPATPSVDIQDVVARVVAAAKAADVFPPHAENTTLTGVVSGDVCALLTPSGAAVRALKGVQDGEAAGPAPSSTSGTAVDHIAQALAGLDVGGSGGAVHADPAAIISGIKAAGTAGLDGDGAAICMTPEDAMRNAPALQERLADSVVSSALTRAPPRAMRALEGVRLLLTDSAKELKASAKPGSATSLTAAERKRCKADAKAATMLAAAGKKLTFYQAATALQWPVLADAYVALSEAGGAGKEGEPSSGEGPSWANIV